MSRIPNGHDPITERDIRSIALRPRWDKQIKEWQDLLKKEIRTNTNLHSPYQILMLCK